MLPSAISASLLVAAVLACPVDVRAQDRRGAAAGEQNWTTAQSLVEDLYTAVTFDAGTSPDWDHVRSMFIESAVVVLRTSRTETTVFSLDGYIGDFVRFIEQANARETGFSERIVRLNPMVFGDMAHILVLYEAHIPGSPRPPQRGVDSFQLIRRDGRWWIVSVTNEIPTANRPVPQALRADTARSGAAVPPSI